MDCNFIFNNIENKTELFCVMSNMVKIFENEFQCMTVEEAVCSVLLVRTEGGTGQR